MRTRSPSRAPPVMGLEGSTATTATGRPASRALPMSAATSVDLPEPGGPVMPTRWARPATGYIRRSAISATGVRFSTAVRILERARRSPVSAASTRASGSDRPLEGAATSVARSGVGPEVLGDFRDGRARPEGRGDPGVLERLHVVVGDDPADDH